MADMIRDNPRMKRVRQLTLTMTVLTGAFFVYWTFNALRFVSHFVFGTGLQESRWVDEGVIVTLGQKAGYFGLWLCVFVTAVFTFYAAFRMLHILRTGAFFTVETCRRIQIFGAALVTTFLCDVVLGAAQFSIFTWHNPIDGAVGYIAPNYYFNSASITIMLCGLGFFAIGWVFYEGAQIEAENKGFV